MTDKRERILARLFTTLGGIEGIVQTYRDRAGIQPMDPETKAALLPAIILLDGTERVKVGGKMTGGRVVPSVVTMEPQIFVILMPRKANVGIGEELSLFRCRVINAIVKDDTLIALLGANGGMEYRGCETDMQTGSSIEGQLQLMLAFDYTLNPNDLL